METSNLPDAKTIIELSWIGLWAFGIIALGFTALGLAAFLKTEDSAGTFSKLFERLQIH